MYTVNPQQCNKTNSEILKQIMRACVCNVCKQIPIPLIRDRLDKKLAYCTECAIISKINKIKPTYEDKCLLDALIVDCKRYCGQTFTYNTFENYLEHYSECDYSINTPGNTCIRCRKLLNESDHDCLLSTNKRITSVEKTMYDNFEIINTRNEKRFTELESKINIKIDQFIEMMNKYRSEADEIKTELNKKQNEERRKIDEIEEDINKTYRENILINNNLKKEFNTLLNSKFNELKLETNKTQEDFGQLSKISLEEFNNIISVMKGINLKTMNLNIEEQKILNEKLISDIENLKKHFKYYVYDGNRSEFIAELSNKLKNSHSNPQPIDNKFKSFVKSDIFKTNHSFSNNSLSELINSLKTIIDLEEFKKNYESINKNIDCNNQNTILYGNIKDVIKNAHESRITSMIIKQNMLISSSGDGSIKIWYLNKNSLHKEIMNAHKGKCVSSLLPFNEKDSIISGGSDLYIRFWDSNYNQLDTSINHGSEVHHMLKSNNILIVGDEDRIIKIYDLQTKLLVNIIKSYHERSIKRLLLLATRDILLSGSDDSTIKVWKMKDFSIENISNNTNKCISTIRIHNGGITALLQLKSNNNILISTDYNGTIAFSSISQNYQIINKYDISHYDDYPLKNDWLNYMHVYESIKFNMLISITSGSSLLCWNLSDYEIIRNVRFHKRLITIVGLEDEKGIIFGQGENHNIVIWK